MIRLRDPRDVIIFATDGIRSGFAKDEGEPFSQRYGPTDYAAPLAQNR